MSTTKIDSLQPQHYGAILIIGNSGSGKSTLVKQYLAEYGQGKDLYVINSKDDEYKSVAPDRVLISMSETQSIKENSIVIIEDIIRLSKKDSEAISVLLNFQVHHSNLKLFCITHHVYKTCIYCLLSFFHSIFFTSDSNNSAIIKLVARAFSIEKPTYLEWSRIVGKNIYKPGKFYVFDVKHMKLLVYSTWEDISQCRGVDIFESEVTDETTDRAAQLHTRFNAFLSHYPHYKSASMIFAIIIECLPMDQIRPRDFTIMSENAKKQTIRISIVDYITSLTSPSAHVDMHQLSFHRYITSRCKIPDFYIRNVVYK
jgi:ABC-type dipeptide/oligopeptide/nickel transport system ATPase component